MTARGMTAAALVALLAGPLGCLSDAPGPSTMEPTDGEVSETPDLGQGGEGGEGDAPADDRPVEDAVGGDPAEDTPAEDTPDDTPDDDTPVDETGGDDTPIDESGDDDPPIDDPPVDETRDETGEDDPVEDPIPECMATAGECWTGPECCAGLFCTYDGGSYLPGQCAHPQPDGSACLTDEWCHNGHCVDGTCQPEACAGKDQECWGDGECCGGTFCTWAGAYVPGSCQAPQPNGAPCNHDAWCQSGFCVDGVCAPEGCSPQGEGCFQGDECCTGVCAYDPQNVYAPGACITPQPDGASCLEDAWCASGTCTDGICGEKICAEKGQECWVSEDCCDTSHQFCTNTWQDYSKGECATKQPDGAYCFAPDWCQSGHCVDSACAPAGCQPLDEPCFSGGECCTGMCTWAGEGDAAGTCAKPAPDGSACVADSWCESGWCDGGTCAVPAGDQVTFGTVWETVFLPNGCASGYCHGSPNGGLYMPDEETAYTNLVGIPTAKKQCGFYTVRVVPGSPAESALWHLTTPLDLGGDYCETKMPAGSKGLGIAEVTILTDWISQGALP